MLNHINRNYVHIALTQQVCDLLHDQSFLKTLRNEVCLMFPLDVGSAVLYTNFHHITRGFAENLCPDFLIDRDFQNGLILLRVRV